MSTETRQSSLRGIAKGAKELPRWCFNKIEQVIPFGYDVCATQFTLYNFFRN